MKINWLFSFQGECALFCSLDENNEIKYGLINRKGEVIIEPIYSWICDHTNCNLLILFLFSESKSILANTKGEILLPAKYEDLSLWEDKKHLTACLNGQWGVINLKDEVIIPFQPMHMQHPPERGYIKFNLSKDKKNPQYGLMDISGKIILEPVYKWIWIDKSGGWVFIDNGKEQYYVDSNMNKTLDFPNVDVIDLGYYWHYDHSTARVKTNSSEKVGLINRAGEFVIKPMYDEINYWGEGLARVKLNGIMGVVSFEGNVVVPLEYTMIETWSDKEHFTVQNVDGLWGAINLKGQVVVPFQSFYWMFTPDSMGRIKVVQKDRYRRGLIDTSGRVILDTIYDEIVEVEAKTEWLKVGKDGECYYLDENLEKHPLF